MIGMMRRMVDAEEPGNAQETVWIEPRLVQRSST
jgi:hypothetical protein